MTAFADHDAYIAAAPEALRPLLTRLRARLAQALPDAEEVIQYDMPGFSSAGLVIAGYAPARRSDAPDWPGILGDDAVGRQQLHA